MRRFLFSVGVVALVAGFVRVPDASAQQQSVNLFVGGFYPEWLYNRGADDVLLNNSDFLAFDFHNFTGTTFGGEWLIGLGDLFDAGIGASYYQRTVPAVYYDFVNANGSEIDQDLKLRIVPITATFRFLPLGHRGFIRPYIGAGAGIFNWHYSESGEFVDFDNNYEIFRNTYTATGTEVGPVVLGGVTFPLGPVDMGGEIRWQQAKGNLPASQGFAGSRIDLGGMNYLFVVNVRF